MLILFVDIALTCFDSSINSFLFEVIFFSLLSKFLFFTKLAICFSLAKFSCLSLAVECSDVDLFNSWVVIYLLWPWSGVILFSISLIFVIVIFLTKLLALGISFSTAVRTVVVASLILCISPLILFILALREVAVATLVISGILSSICLILELYISSLTTSLFTTSLSLLKSTETDTNLSLPNLSTFFSNCLN